MFGNASTLSTKDGKRDTFFGERCAGRRAFAKSSDSKLPRHGYGGPAQPSPTIGQCINCGLGWLEVEGNRCKARASGRSMRSAGQGHADLEA
jgi:hypothetical protein